MAKYKLAVNQGKNLDNYILCLERFGAISSRLLTHKEMYQSHNKNDGTSDS